MNSYNNNGGWEIASSSEEETEQEIVCTRQRDTLWFQNFSNEEYGVDWPEYLRKKNSIENGCGGEPSTHNNESHSETRSSTENQSVLDTSLNSNLIVVKVGDKLTLVQLAHADRLENNSLLVRAFFFSSNCLFLI